METFINTGRNGIIKTNRQSVISTLPVLTKSTLLEVKMANTNLPKTRLTRQERGCSVEAGGNTMNEQLSLLDLPLAPLPFAGATYDAKYDCARLTGQILRIREAMLDGKWRTLPEIENVTGDGQASISAQLRNLRKPAFGSHQVDKRRRGEAERGCWEYRLTI